MFQNYLTIALRNLSRFKSYALLNVGGLALGVACSLLIFLLVRFHLSVDGYHAKADRIYRVVSKLHFDQDINTPGVPNPFGKAFRNDFPDVEDISTVRWRHNLLVTIGGQDGTAPKKFKIEEKVALVEPSFFKIFDYQWVKGTPSELEAPFVAVLTEKSARKFFGDADPIGQSFLYNNWKEMKVVGLVADHREDTDFKPEIFVSYATYLASDEGGKDHWNGVSSNNQVFLALPEGMSGESVQAQLPGFSKRYIAQDPEKYEFVMQPLADMHFNSDFGGDAPKPVIWALALVGLFLLLTACINFINLATAQALNRAKEVGVRKVVGSGRGMIFAQFMTETFLIVLAATALGVLLAQLILPSVRTLTQTPVFLKIGDPGLWLFLAGTAVFATILAGAYPAMVISGFRPVAAIKGSMNTRTLGGYNIRRGLVIAQFAICQLLIIAALVIGRQMNFIKNADLGFDPTAVINMGLHENSKTKRQSLQAQFSQIPGVEMISFNDDAPASGNSNTSNCRFDTHEKDEPWMIQTKPADDQFVQTFGLKIVAGRNVMPSDTLRETLLNETAVKKLGLASPQEAVGKRFQIWGNWTEVAGVVKDFHTSSMQVGINPTVIIPMPSSFSNISLKIDLNRKDEVLKSVEKVWNDAFPKEYFEFEYSDALVAEFYELEDILLKMVRFFCGVAIFIACMGLYGLVSFLALRKKKEIGIRKVLGATVANVVGIFGKEFALLMLVGFALAAPLGFWAMRIWLDDYTYRIPLGVGIFLAAIGFSALIALATVGWQSLRSALANPATALRSE